MELQLGEILMMKPVIDKMIQTEISVKAAFKLSKLVRVLNPELQDIEKCRAELVNKHGEKAEDGGTQVSKENEPLFIKEFDEFLQETTEVAIETMSLDELCDIKMTTADISKIEKLIE